MRDWNLQFVWQPHDFWIGVEWHRTGNCFDLRICVLPMIPLHFSCWGERWRMKEPGLEPQ
jgi:hypothetical protein